MVTYVKLLLTAIFWGGTFVAGRSLAQHVGPYSAAFLRFAVASLFLVFITWKVEGRLALLKRGQLLPVFLLGLTGVFFYNVFFFKGLKLIEAGRAAIIIANNPILIALLSAAIFKEKLNAIKATGIGISVTGAILAISKGDLRVILQGHLGWGEFYIFLCVASWVTFSLLGKAVMSGLSPLASVTYSSLTGTLLLLIPAFREGIVNCINFSIYDWWNIFYLGFFGTVLGFVWFYEGIKKIGPTKAGLFINFVPISAILLAFFLLDEPVTFSLLIGALLVTTGVYLTNRP
ncbi:MAG: DMT family transporter [Deltaproteobacteria bacterium]|jgi:drug/metabolite transporter (DMT)-like permease|nr:DMT family transporter [Deltaproteobacteria bacterium]